MFCMSWRVLIEMKLELSLYPRYEYRSQTVSLCEAAFKKEV